MTTAERAAQIVDDRFQHRLAGWVLVAIAVPLLLGFGGMFVVLSLGPIREAWDQAWAPAAQGWGPRAAALTLLVITAAVAILIVRRAERQRRRALAVVIDLLDHGQRTAGRVVQARRVSMTQVRLAVQAPGFAFSELVSSGADEAAWIGRQVTVVHDPRHPGFTILDRGD